jgi:hypothetical protein
MKKFNFLGTLAVLLMIILLIAGSARATLIGVDLGLPDIISNSTGSYQYNSGTQLFTSTAQALAITFDGTTVIPITNGSYSVQFYVDNSGNFLHGVTGYDSTISGTFTYGTKTYSGTLIEGEVTNFGWQNIPGYKYAFFDFSFDFKDGALNDFYAASGNKGGDIFTSESSNFTGNWNGDHSGTKVKYDTAPVPEPTTILLFGLGIVGIAIFGRRRIKK